MWSNTPKKSEKGAEDKDSNPWRLGLILNKALQAHLPGKAGNLPCARVMRASLAKWRTECDPFSREKKKN
jgi:hypothetical protein